MKSKCLWKALIASFAILLIPAFVEAQRGGGFRGGGGMRGGGQAGGGMRGGAGGFAGGGMRGGGMRGGGMRGGRGGFDPDMIFKMMSRGKDHIDIANSGRSKSRLEEFAKKNGISNGKITKDQFKKYMEQRKQGGGPRGSGGGEKSAKSGGDSNRSGKSRTRSKEDIEKEVKRSTDSYFYGRDKNKDKVLDQSEMSDRLKPVYKKYDRNGDGKINYDEAKEYIRGYVDRRNGRSGSNSGSRSASTTSVDQSILEKRAIVYRVGTVPDSMPSWFKETDVDGDAQVGLYEWRELGKDLKSFDQYDRNRDGFVTVEELMYHQAKVTVAKADDKGGKSDGANKSGSISPSSDGKKDFASRIRSMFGNRGRGGGSTGAQGGRSGFGGRFGSRGRPRKGG